MDNKEIVLNAMRAAGVADATALAAQSVAGELDSTALIAAEVQIPTWR